MLAGGVINPAALRLEDEAITFILGLTRSEKAVAALRQGPWTLINAGAVKGRRMMVWPSHEVDPRNARAEWVDEAVVVDRGLVTSRKPDDLPALCAKAIEALAADPPPG